MNITVIDGTNIGNPEVNAMLQAFYSRSHRSIQDRLNSLGSDEEQIKNSLKKYYFGYGHQSIAEGGFITIYFEQVSILFAKAIQDNPLYSGTESSTRFINFESQPIISPIPSEELSDIQKSWVNFYYDSFDELQDYLFHQYPKTTYDLDSNSLYIKSIQAHTFDILRAFIPAGMCTQLSWTTNLRQAQDKLWELSFHVCSEIRTVAKLTLEILSTRYPNSIRMSESCPYKDFLKDFNKENNYEMLPALTKDFDSNVENKKPLPKFFKFRPKGCSLPNYTNSYGTFNFWFHLDYGSFRDIQRHRNGICRLPLLTADLGFSDWYLLQLPVNLRHKALELIDSNVERTKSLVSDIHERQYYYPLGLNVQCKAIYGVAEAVYVAELRTSPNVHPTLRTVAIKMSQEIRRHYPDIVMYSNEDIVKFNPNRGSQDIVEK